MKKRYYAIIVVAAIFCLALVWVKWNEYKKFNNYANTVIENINNLNTEETRSIELSSITPFTWEEAYIFKPYIDKAGIKEVIKCTPKGYQTSLSDSDSQIYFINQGKVVCSINGNSEKLNFYINYNFEDYYYKLNQSAVIKLETINNKKSIDITQ